MKTLRIVSRKSPLALWQAEFVKTKLNQLYPALSVTILGVTTEGDTIQNVPLYNIGGKALFVKELEKALLEEEADIAVHSMKDVPAMLPEGLEISAILEREDPRDALVTKQYTNIASLPSNARVGTSSLRRQSQLRALRPDLTIIPLRGNVDTRVQKLELQEFDALILAVAGLKRLGLEKYISDYLSPTLMLPSIGQGALGIECRSADQMVKKLIKPLNHTETSQCLMAERSMNALLGGGCQLPVSGLATLCDTNQLTLTGLVASPDGLITLKSTGVEKRENAEALGKKVATQLIDQGARFILKPLME